MAEDHSLINLKILSPSTEVKGDINLPDMPASTTIRELRLRIQNEISSRPATERMRLIYRGRVVLNETDTLIDVFGLENIRNSKEQSLHLVLRELPPTANAASPAPRSSTAPPNPFRPAPTPPQANPPQTNPFRAFQQPRPNSQPQTPHQQLHPHHYHHHHHAHPHLPPGQLPLPPVVNNLLQQQIAQAMAQNNNQAVPPNRQSREGTPAPPDSIQAPRTGTPPIAGSVPANLPPNSTTTIRREAIGPNGERWTMTSYNTNLTIPAHPQQQPFLPRPFPHPPGFPLPLRSSPGPPGDAVEQVLPRVRIGLQTARQEMDNVRILLQGPDGGAALAGAIASPNPPVWRIDRIRYHVQNLTQNLEHVQRGLASIVANPSMAHNQDVVSLQQAANDLRGHAEDLNGMLDRLRNEGASNQASSTQNESSGSAPLSTPTTEPRASTPQTQSQQAASQPSAVATAPELFILSSPQGPVGILYDQRGMYSTAPMVSTLPFQAFTQQFSSNRQLLAGIGQQIAQNSTQLHNQLAAGQQPTQNVQPAAGAQPPADQSAAQNQNQNQNQNANQPQVQNPAPENDRLAEWVRNAWLVFKVSCFIYLFAGNGGWYRPLMMGAVAIVVILAQRGVFETQFNMIRRHFEALLPLADRQPQNANGQAQRQGEQRTEPGRDITPEQAAQRLVQQHQEQWFGWIRQSMRTTERAFALFVASLWPGIGERMVQAQEERARAERAAEEERRRQEEERQQQQEAQKNEETQEAAPGEQKTEPTTASTPTEPSSSTKGKEKVEVAEEGSSS